MKVILAEKPSVARDIAKVLNVTGKKDGYIENNEYAVTWAFGHLVSLSNPEKQNSKWTGSWNLNNLPMIPENWKFEVNQDGKKQFKVISKLFKEADEIICATDAGREGEHIFRLIYNESGCKKPFKRLWISSLTEASIKNGFENLKNGSEFDNLADSADCRAKSDWIVGLNSTQGYTVHNDQLCTIGRVQTPTLSLIVNRENDIKNFSSKTYYELNAVFEKFSAKYFEEKESKFFEKDKIDEIVKSLESVDSLIVSKVEDKEKIIKAPGFFNLLNLQKECNSKFGYSAQETLNIAQALYEKHKIITYPRTESCHISEDMVSSLHSLVDNIPEDFSKFADIAKTRLNDGLTLGKTYVNDAKLTDHHAVIVSDKKAKMSDLSEQEKNIYLLICKKFLAVFLPENILAETKVELKADNKTFKATGTVTVQEGFKELYLSEKKEKKDKTLPVLKENMEVKLNKFKLDEKQTKPPKSHNESSLLTAMKTAGKEIDEKELALTIKENGLGTPATRASIIERLITTGYIERQKKTLIPTQKGFEIIEVVSPDLKSAVLTAKWEEKLKLVEDGKYNKDDFLNEISDLISEIISSISSSKKITNNQPQAEKYGECPICKKGELIKGKKGVGCSDWKSGCKFVIWLTVAKKKLPEKEIKNLIKDGKTGLIKGFKSKKDKPFDAVLKFDDEFKVVFDFENKEQVAIGECPLCKKGKVVQNSKGFGCSDWKSGCKFVVWNEIYKKKINKGHVSKLIHVGKTNVLKGFVDKKGDKYDGQLELKNGKVIVDRVKTKRPLERSK